MTEYTDTDRLDFLLRYIDVDDIGDETYIPGVGVHRDDMERDLTWSKTPNKHGYFLHLFAESRGSKNSSWDLRTIIDKAITDDLFENKE